MHTRVDPQLYVVGSNTEHIEWVDGFQIAVSSLDLECLTLGPLGINPGGPAVRINKRTHDNVMIPLSFTYTIPI